ncbi:MAG TPA: hypothetical protein VND21_08225, partial [Planctomycetota bacterium]|nr:hypothetical protein [Planctomycetota bacterium]
MNAATPARACACLMLATGFAACGSGGGGSGGGGDAASPVIVSFMASPALVRAGDPVALTAVFDGVDAMLLPGGDAPTSGVPLEVRPSVDTTYTLVVTGSDGDLATAEVVVTVVDLLFDVTSAADTGPGTLREAMEVASATSPLRTAARVVLGGSSTVVLESPLPPIAGACGPTTFTVDGAGTHRPFFVDGGRASLADLTIRGGRAEGEEGGASWSLGGGGGGAGGLGGAAFLQVGSLDCTRVRFLDNHAVGGGGGGSTYVEPVPPPPAGYPL